MTSDSEASSPQPPAPARPLWHRVGFWGNVLAGRVANVITVTWVALVAAILGDTSDLRRLAVRTLIALHLAFTIAMLVLTILEIRRRSIHANRPATMFLLFGIPGLMALAQWGRTLG